MPFCLCICKWNATSLEIAAGGGQKDEVREVQRQRIPTTAGCCLDEHYLLQVCKHSLGLAAGAVVHGRPGDGH